MPPVRKLPLSRFGMLAAVILAVLSGCKPAPPTVTAQQTPPPDATAPHQPTAKDFQTFFQTMLPAAVKVSEVKMDAPTRMPNTSPDQNIWLLSLKITVTPLEDLYALPPPQNTQPIDNIVAELNALVAWRNAYAQSPYVKACGGLEIKVPAAPLPQLLVVAHPKDHPLEPIYAKMVAEWQVDHWQFAAAEGNTSNSLLTAGKFRSEFAGPTMVQGSPEAEKAIGGVRDAITQARKEIDAIRGRYAEQIAQGTKPGTVYQGRVTFRQNVQPCEVRFVDPPPGADAHSASVEVTLPNEKPPCVFTYNAKIKTELPIPVPGTQPAQEKINPVFDLDASGQPLVFNMRVSLVRSVGKMDERTLPGQVLSGNRHDTGSQTLLLLGGHLEGIISYYNAPGITVSAQQVNPTR